MKRNADLLRILLLLFVGVSQVVAQPLPPASGSTKRRFDPDLVNRFQVGAYVGGALNVYKGIYSGACPCEFVKSGSGWNVPFGISVNIPIGSDASLYLRAGFNNMSLAFDAARADTLRSARVFGEMVEDLTIETDILQFDLLLRLIAEEQGVRLLAGPTFGLVKSTTVELNETELVSGKSYLIERGELAEAVKTRYGFILGIEYALIPFPRVYVIPAFVFNYGWNFISTAQSLRPLSYTFSLTFAYAP